MTHIWQYRAIHPCPTFAFQQVSGSDSSRLNKLGNLHEIYRKGGASAWAISQNLGKINNTKNETWRTQELSFTEYHILKNESRRIKLELILFRATLAAMQREKKLRKCLLADYNIVLLVTTIKWIHYDGKLFNVLIRKRELLHKCCGNFVLFGLSNGTLWLPLSLIYFCLVTI